MAGKKRNILDTLARLENAEQEFLRTEFLAPVLGGGKVGMKIAGVRCEMSVEPRDYTGFGVFAPLSHAKAKLVRDATMSERRKYLELFPRVHLIPCQQEKEQWLCAPSNKADTRFRIVGLVPVLFVEDAQLFDVIVARYDGSHFWFDRVDDREDPAAAVYLRQELGKLTEPKKLGRPGLGGGQREAYEVVYQIRLKQQAEDERSRGENRLRDALVHAGAELKDYAERKDQITVTYTVDGRRHTSVVRKNDLTVVTAGICLSGGDRHFDLASLVGVLREQRNRQ